MILLDTSIFLYIAQDRPVRPDARAAIEEAAALNRLWVSSVTAWELGLLATRTGQTGPRLGDARVIFDTVVTRARLQVIPLSSAAALDAAYLPEPFHRDPSDRMLVATARLAELAIATNDRKILDYAKLGHVRTIKC